MEEKISLSDVKTEITSLLAHLSTLRGEVDGTVFQLEQLGRQIFDSKNPEVKALGHHVTDALTRADFAKRKHGDAKESVVKVGRAVEDAKDLIENVCAGLQAWQQTSTNPALSKKLKIYWMKLHKLL